MIGCGDVGSVVSHETQPITVTSDDNRFLVPKLLGNEGSLVGRNLFSILSDQDEPTDDKRFMEFPYKDLFIGYIFQLFTNH